jgi:hypothetical protein
MSAIAGGVTAEYKQKQDQQVMQEKLDNAAREAQKTGRTRELANDLLALGYREEEIRAMVKGMEKSTSVKEGAYAIRDLLGGDGIGIVKDGAHGNQLYNEVKARLEELSVKGNISQADLDTVAREFGVNGQVNWKNAMSGGQGLAGQDAANQNLNYEFIQGRGMVMREVNPQAGSYASLMNRISDFDSRTQMDLTAMLLGKNDPQYASRLGAPSNESYTDLYLAAGAVLTAPFMGAAGLGAAVVGSSMLWQNGVNYALDQFGVSKRFAPGLSGDITAGLYGVGTKSTLNAVYFGHWSNSKDVAVIFAGSTGIADVRQATQTGLQYQTPASAGWFGGYGLSAFIAFGSGGAEGFSNYSEAFNVGLGPISGSVGRSDLNSDQSFWNPKTDAYAFLGVGLLGNSVGVNYEKYMVQPLLQYGTDGTITSPMFKQNSSPWMYTDYRLLR